MNLVRLRKSQSHHFLYGFEKMELQIIGEGILFGYMGLCRRFFVDYQTALLFHQNSFVIRSSSHLFDQMKSKKQYRE